MTSGDSDSTTSSDFNSEKETEFELTYEMRLLNNEDLENLDILTNRIKTVDFSKLDAEKCSIMSIQASDLIMAIFLQLDMINMKSILDSTMAKMLERFKSAVNSHFILFSERVVNIPLKEVRNVYEQISKNDGDWIVISKYKTLSGTALNDAILDFPEMSPKALKKFPCNAEEVFLVDLAEKTEMVSIKNECFRIMLIRKEKVADFISKLEKEEGLEIE